MNEATNSDRSSPYTWPLVAAPKGYGVLYHIDHHDREVEPVIAFVVGKGCSLPVTRFGVIDDAWLECPELIVRRFSSSPSADDREFPDVETARAVLSAERDAAS
jgi:hypothetical protein